MRDRCEGAPPAPRPGPATPARVPRTRSRSSPAPSHKRKRAAEESVRSKLNTVHEDAGWKGKGNRGQPRPTPTSGALLALCWRSAGALLALCWRSAVALLALCGRCSLHAMGCTQPPQPKPAPRRSSPECASRPNHLAQLGDVAGGTPGGAAGAGVTGGGRGGGLARWGTGRVSWGSQH
jgi:hypothetical protein